MFGLSKNENEWDWFLKHRLGLNKRKEENAYNWLNYLHEKYHLGEKDIADFRIQREGRKDYHITIALLPDGSCQMAGLWYGNRDMPVVSSTVVSHLDEIETNIGLVDSIKKIIKADNENRMIKYVPRLKNMDLDNYFPTQKQLKVKNHPEGFKYVDLERKITPKQPSFKQYDDLKLYYC